MNPKESNTGVTEVTHIYPIVKDSTGNDVNFEKHLLVGSGCWCIPRIEIDENNDVLVSHNPKSKTDEEGPVVLDGEMPEYNG